MFCVYRRELTEGAEVAHCFGAVALAYDVNSDIFEVSFFQFIY